MDESWHPAVVLIVPHWTAAPTGSRWTDGLSGTTSETTGTTPGTTGTTSETTGTAGGYEPRDTRYDRSFNRPAGPSDLDKDFAAMKRVWQMIRAGAVRMVGEIGRQY